MVTSRTLNHKGLTIFELLVTISIGGIVVTLLLSLLSTTLLTRNHIDYTNRLDEEIYYMNNQLNETFLEMNFRSIRELETPETFDFEVFLLNNEYDAIDGEITYEVFYQRLLLIDYDKGSMYLIPVPSTGYTIPRPDELSFDDYRPLLEHPPEQYRINSARLNILKPETGERSIHVQCLGVDGNNVYGSCSSAFIEFTLEISYTLTSGESLGKRAYAFTLIY